MPGLHVSLQQELPTKFLQKHQTLEWHSVGVRLRIHVPLQRLDFWQMFSCICNSSTNFLRHAFLLNDKPNKFIIEYFATLCAFEAHIIGVFAIYVQIQRTFLNKWFRTQRKFTMKPPLTKVLRFHVLFESRYGLIDLFAEIARKKKHFLARRDELPHVFASLLHLWISHCTVGDTRIWPSVCYRVFRWPPFDSNLCNFPLEQAYEQPFWYRCHKYSGSGQ